MSLRLGGERKVRHQEKSLPIGFRVQVIIEPDGAGFHVYCPALKGLHTCGDTEKEALENAKDAIIAYLKSLMKHGDPIPIGVEIQKGIRKGVPLLPKGHPKKHTEELVLAVS